MAEVLNYYDAEDVYNARGIGSDLGQCIYYNLEDKLKLDEIKKVVAFLYNDEEGGGRYIWVVELNQETEKGHYALINGNNGSTGWDYSTAAIEFGNDPINLAGKLLEDKDDYIDEHVALLEEYVKHLSNQIKTGRVERAWDLGQSQMLPGYANFNVSGAKPNGEDKDKFQPVSV